MKTPRPNRAGALLALALAASPSPAHAADPAPPLASLLPLASSARAAPLVSLTPLTIGTGTGAAPAAAADDASAPAASIPRGVRARPTLAAGFAFPLVGYEGYGIGPDVRAGVDLAFGDERAHLLATELAWSAQATAGARLDLVTASAGWRWIPSSRVGFYTLVSLGAGVAVDTLDLQLGARTLAATTARPAALVAPAIGWTFFDHVDLELVYRQSVLGGDVVDALGTVGFRLGGRL